MTEYYIIEKRLLQKIVESFSSRAAVDEFLQDRADIEDYEMVEKIEK